MAKIAAVLAVLLAGPSAALAQDFGVDWIDRVTHERQADRGPLKPVPVAITLSAGVAVYRDDNLFLEERKENDDTIVIPFLGARLDYSEPEFDAAADFLGNYKSYSDEDENTSYEQRFFGRARYVGPRFNAEVVQVVQNLSDPTDVVFSSRIERLISDTAPKLTWDMTRTVALELAGHAQLVRYEDDGLTSAPGDNSLQAIENNTFRADGSIVYRVPNGYDWVLQGGYLLIDYVLKQSRGGAPDAEGWYGRGGFRGDVSPQVTIEALVGYVGVQSSKYFGTPEREEMNTGEAIVRTRVELIEKLSVTADFTRLVTFAGATSVTAGVPDPFQVVNRFTAWIDYEPIERLKVRPRVQYDDATSSLGIERDFLSAGIAANYQVLDQPSIFIEAGATWREGETGGDVVQTSEFENAIFHGGLVISY